MSRFYRRICLVILFSLGAVCGTFAQLLDITNQTRVPTPGADHDYVQMLSETVDPSSGSASVRIAVPMPRGRMITLPFNFDYDSSGLFYVTGLQPYYSSTLGYLYSGGWAYSVPIVGYLSGQTKHTDQLGRSWICHWRSNFMFRSPLGRASHNGISQPTSAVGQHMRPTMVDP